MLTIKDPEIIVQSPVWAGIVDNAVDKKNLKISLLTLSLGFLNYTWYLNDDSWLSYILIDYYISCSLRLYIICSKGSQMKILSFSSEKTSSFCIISFSNSILLIVGPIGTLREL